ncbi:SRPBCC family protein [Lacinutrix jangbogonensis]|uniref:SRPBCC family protein n=1 Tax=Lacinutrix jangbogonensis TaxID=1469557 RepID=UPI00053E2D8F|nr:SRPBCC family protein [Lacinutrix jangbogonensis]
MKFTCAIDINADIKTIQAAFFNTDDMKYYQDGFQSKTLIRGNPGEKGAKSKLVFDKLELIETIIVNDLPENFLALYEHKHTTNTMHVSFKPLANNKVRYTSIVEYTKLNGLVIKLIAKVYPSMFKKQIDKWLKQFKTHVENK